MNSATAALKHDIHENWPKNNTKSKHETPVCAGACEGAETRIAV